MMADIVFMVVFARSDGLKIAMRLIRTEKADFTGRMARDREEKKILAARAFDFQAKAFIGLFEGKNIGKMVVKLT
jgi:NADPH-dependent curcumin reductase CurA